MNNFCRILALGSMAFTINGMETPLIKNKSCGHDLKKSALLAIDRAFIASSGISRVFEPASDTLARKLFKRKNISGACKIDDLTSDADLHKVASLANLNGLTIFASDDVVQEYPQNAFTGASVAEFKNGKIHHAIVVPTCIYRIEDQDTRRSILHGVVEREIARIHQAYTGSDEALMNAKQLAFKVLYGTAAFVAGCWEPSSLFGSIPAASVIWGGFLDANYDAFLDEQVLNMTGNSKNLLATILHISSDAEFHKILVSHAQDAVEGLESTWSLTPREGRLYTLLKAQEAWDKKVKAQETQDKKEN